MGTRTLETDYLVVGAGACGTAFADSLIFDSDADVVIVDRRHAPGGHWNDAYPFVRLHQPAAYYGVNSLPLGSETIDRAGMNQGLYAQAGGGLALRDIAGWLERSRLNVSRGLNARSEDPRVQQARKRLRANALPGLQNLMQIVGASVGRVATAW